MLLLIHYYCIVFADFYFSKVIFLNTRGPFTLNDKDTRRVILSVHRNLNVIEAKRRSSLLAAVVQCEQALRSVRTELLAIAVIARNGRSQIGTVQAVDYIEVRSPTEGHWQMPNQAPRVTSQ